MRNLRELVKCKGWTQTDAAARCLVTQPRISNLLRGRISRFSLDALVNMAAAAGPRIHVKAVQRHRASSAGSASRPASL
jgi:predicted XRE-type DNA-binding protein